MTQWKWLVAAGVSMGAILPGALLRAADGPTYAKEVSRIVQKNCEGCHRKGQIGPFPLTNYEQVSAFKSEIKRVTGARTMPPWSAVPGHGEFRNERRLTEEEIATLAKWVDAGSPLGDKKDLPAAVKWNDDWTFGQPDLVFAPEGEYELSGNGADEYRCFVVPSGLVETRYIAALEVRPGNRKIVHHVRVFADLSGKARELDAADPKPGFDCSLGMVSQYKRIGLGGWAPGLVPDRHSEEVGRAFPKGADVVMEVHYHKNGLKEKDRSTVGIWLHKDTPRYIQKSAIVVNPFIKIPAGEEHHMERASWTAQKDIVATSVLPHMHLLGTEMRVTATFPDGSRRDLVWSKPYDFNWQTSYSFKEPIRMPKGTKIEAVAYYNNSESNPKNPSNPLKEVRWGEGTNEEMLVAFVGYIDDPGPGVKLALTRD